MKIRIFYLFLLTMFCISRISYTQENVSDFPVLTGPYLGQKPPGTTPEIFAPRIISTAQHEHSFPAFSPDGSDIYWTVGFTTTELEFPPMILFVQQQDGQWTSPEIVSFSGQYPDGEGCFFPDGRKFFFGSQRPVNNYEKSKSDLDLWFVERTAQDWSEPQRLDTSINTSHHEMQPSITRDSTLYYVGYWENGKNNYGIYSAEYGNGKFFEPVLLDSTINTEFVEWTPFIDPDENYLLFSSTRPGGFGRGDIYICFRNKDGSWTEALNLGPEINKADNERFPCISPDGKYLFYLTDRVPIQPEDLRNVTYEQIVNISINPGNGYCDIYWVDAKIIEEMKPDHLK